MADLVIGAAVSCQDGPCGELVRVVVDPVAKALTHLVVGTTHPVGVHHLVPVDLVTEASSPDQLQLACTLEGFHALEEAEETHFLDEVQGEWGYDQEDMASLPYFGLGLTAGGMGGAGMDRMGSAYAPQFITVDRVPVGEVQVRRGEHVRATDGPVGRVRGLVVDPADHHVTHVLLDEGHLWGKKEVAIPIGAVRSVEDGIEVDLSKSQLRDLPPVPVEGT